MKIKAGLAFVGAKGTCSTCGTEVELEREDSHKILESHMRRFYQCDPITYSDYSSVWKNCWVIRCPSCGNSKIACYKETEDGD